MKRSSSFEIDPGGPTSLGDRGFSGSIELQADDKAYVLRSDPARRGTASNRIKFFCSREPPQIAVDLSGPQGSRSAPLKEGQRYFSNSRNVQVHVSRKSAIPARVAVVDRATGGAVEDDEVIELLSGHGLR